MNQTRIERKIGNYCMVSRSFLLLTYLPILLICINTYIKERKKMRKRRSLENIFWRNIFFIKLFKYIYAVLKSFTCKFLYCNLKVTCLRKTKAYVLVFATLFIFCQYLFDLVFMNSRY